MPDGCIDQVLAAAQEPCRVGRSHILAAEAGQVGLLGVIAEVVERVDLRGAVGKNRQAVISSKLGRVVIADD